MPTKRGICLLAGALLMLSGCASISRGVTEAILDYEVDDERRCWITGRTFKGLDDLFLESTEGDSPPVARLKVLTVHGIGSHSPGYSRRLLDSLVPELGMTSMSERVKVIPLIHPEHSGDLGVLSVYRFLNGDRSREVLFYELTWDSIVEEQIRIIDYDSGQEASAKRAPLNHAMKVFVNDSVPDALIYNTSYRKPMQLSVAQAGCWLLTTKWDDLPHEEAVFCDASLPEAWLNLSQSNFAVISHSLGSRISMDAIQQTMMDVARRPELSDLGRQLKFKPFHLYMLSNQLPLLQVGQPLPEVQNRIGAYCLPEGEKHSDRLLGHMQIVAFSDPNDLFTYRIKPAFVERYIDSRLCPTITNVEIEVAQVTSLLGTGAFANPQSAHADYEIDPRVIRLLVSGLGSGRYREQIGQSCQTVETIPED